MYDPAQRPEAQPSGLGRRGFHEETEMKRSWMIVGSLALFSVAVSAPARAQMGMDIFKRPSITKAFHPVIGKGAAYEDTGKEAKPRTTEISIVGKDSIAGKDAYWMQFVSTGPDGKSYVGKMLIAGDDFQPHRMIVQPPGQQAMEIPTQMSGAGRQRMQDNMTDWHSVGPDTITVPAGTFACEHWHSDNGNADAWTSEKVTPFGLVKFVSGNGGTQILVKVVDNVTDRITGPVKQFDMQEMMQQMQQRRQQPQQ